MTHVIPLTLLKQETKLLAYGIRTQGVKASTDQRKAKERGNERKYVSSYVCFLHESGLVNLRVCYTILCLLRSLLTFCNSCVVRSPAASVLRY
jgi:hypothetical protein